MIPKILHYVWLGGKPMPEEYKSYIAGWKEKMPDWEIREWNEGNIDISASPYAQEALAEKKYGFVTDYIRLQALCEYGGVYLDTDVEALRPLDGLLEHRLFLGYENDVYVATAILASEPCHPFMIALKEMYEKIHFREGRKLNLMPNPFYFTYFLNRDYSAPLRAGRYDLDGGIALYPRESFSPIDFNTGKDMRTEDTYTVHHFANSWAGKKMKTQEKFLYAVRKIFGRRFFAFVTRKYAKLVFRKLDKKFAG